MSAIVNRLYNIQSIRGRTALLQGFAAEALDITFLPNRRRRA